MRSNTLRIGGEISSMKNFDLYMTSLFLLHASNHLQKHEPEYAKYLLDKSKEYLEKVEVDEKLSGEVEEYAKQIMESSGQGPVIQS